MLPLNILLVDDDRNLATTLSYGLRKALGQATSVTVCFNGTEALAMLKAQIFDVVISDYNMPGMSGLELLRWVSRDHRDVILVLSTAYGTDALEEGVRRLGMGYITKPFEPSELVQLIKSLIQSRETIGSPDKIPSIVDQLGKSAGSSSSSLLEGMLHE